jgi:hypothetical protein
LIADLSGLFEEEMRERRKFAKEPFLFMEDKTRWTLYLMANVTLHFFSGIFECNHLNFKFGPSKKADGESEQI